MGDQIVYIEHQGIMNEGTVLSYDNAPVITKEDYEDRICKLMEAASSFTHLCIYADKEHFSNLEYITGYDPRYEECIMLLKRGSVPRLILGNEGMGQSQCITIRHEKVLFQSLSPMGQPRKTSDSLDHILRDFGIGTDSRVGLLGWKSFTAAEFEDWKHTYEVPEYLVKALKARGADLENANGLMMDSGSGLRAVQDVKTLVLSEIAATKASRKTWKFITGIKEEMTEIEASQLFDIDGEPCPTYPNICFKGRGILSPDYHRKLKLKDPLAYGMGYRYAQIHRVGMYIRSFDDLDLEERSNVDRLYRRYFEAMAVWFETLGIGITGGEVWEKVKKAVGSYEEFGIVLNPGHLIHSEEWMNSPFVKGGSDILKSGMLIQCDFTARPAFCKGLGVHVEDGLMLADEETKDAIRTIAPDSFARMIKRQRFMREVLGIRVKDEVLPTSDTCGMLHPFLADLNWVMAKR